MLSFLLNCINFCPNEKENKVFLCVTPTFFGGMKEVEGVDLDDGRMNRRRVHGGNSELSKRRGGCEEKQRANDLAERVTEVFFLGFP